MNIKIMAKTRKGSTYEFFTNADGKYSFRRNGKEMGEILSITEGEIKVGRHMKIIFKRKGTDEEKKIASSRVMEVYVKC